MDYFCKQYQLLWVLYCLHVLWRKLQQELHFRLSQAGIRLCVRLLAYTVTCGITSIDSLHGDVTFVYICILSYGGCHFQGQKMYCSTSDWEKGANHIALRQHKWLLQQDLDIFKKQALLYLSCIYKSCWSSYLCWLRAIWLAPLVLSITATYFCPSKLQPPYKCTWYARIRMCHHCAMGL